MAVCAVHCRQGVIGKQVIDSILEVTQRLGESWPTLHNYGREMIGQTSGEPRLTIVATWGGDNTGKQQQQQGQKQRYQRYCVIRTAGKIAAAKMIQASELQLGTATSSLQTWKCGGHCLRGTNNLG